MAKNFRPENFSRAPLFLAAHLALAAIFLLCLAFAACSQKTLILRDSKSGALLARFPIPSQEFSVSFKHSVNRSDIEEFYVVKGKKIILTAVEFSSFGAGVLSEVGEGQSLKILDGGKMRLEGIDREVSPLVYAVSVVFDHFLTVGGEKINLTDLGLKDRQVEFLVR